MSDENVVRDGKGNVIMTESYYKQLSERPKSPFSSGKGFAQLNLEHSEDLSALTKANPTARRILDYLIEKTDKSLIVIASYDVFCEVLGVSTSTVQRAVKILKESRFIDVYKTGSSNVYVINSDIVWKTWGDQYMTAEFNAKVIICDKEQHWDSPKVRYHRHKQLYLDDLAEADDVKHTNREWAKHLYVREEEDDFIEDPEDLPMEDVV